MSLEQLEEILKKTQLDSAQKSRVLEAYNSKPSAVKGLEIRKLAKERKDLGKLVEQLRHP